MATTKFLSQDGLLYVWQKIKLLLANKVDIVEGKALSTNDYTNEEKQKLAEIDASADVNVIESITVNGVSSTVTNKAVNISVPTDNNELANGAGYQTASDVSSAINSALAEVTQISYSVVESLPATGQVGVIYLVAHNHGAGDVYDEFIWANDTYEKIGNTDIDLSGYMLISSTITNTEIDTIIAS